MPVESAGEPLPWKTACAAQPASSAAATKAGAIRRCMMAPSVEAMADCKLVARAHAHLLDVGRKVAVADLDLVVTRRELEHAKRGRHAARLAVDIHLAPRDDEKSGCRVP